ncbi:transmembrane 4 L6 family member 20 [Rana temporaria]|uniref:transmembrane 4 L6 family member 20 n=1 Tax=Rana temporaria TaxID=8407 RepID=UPI001AACA2A7|nr:transmembrane 4 L6 family member 20 [Rana temporaria]
MTCTENWSTCNGFFLLALSLLAIILNLTPLIADYVEDGRLFYNSISCYEWWLPGLFGGGLLVLPAVSMTLAARKKGSCNSRCGMLSSSLLCVFSIIGGLYCTLIALFAISKGPLICEKGSITLDRCDYSLRNFSDFQSLNFDLVWYTNTSCSPKQINDSVTVHGISQKNSLDFNLVPDFDLNITIDEDSQKLIHIAVYASLAIVGLLEVVTSVSQIVAGLFGFLCGTSKRHKGQSQWRG